ncbi:hypothetical protein KSX_84360 [Ktedonospora formicarum]|uniref:Uncharacterized protein n=1 Tax=Ktedonospora formicarum TaxID=2778364 RepID=A0A8J3IAG6_9CHLR|nr:iron chelate uptake ABC transporter family permease subunit [Ktedonospora formicarum]GHO50273.1 hypothetical protein KSX_84360 [Ktedonospora formicarum]
MKLPILTLGRKQAPTSQSPRRRLAPGGMYTLLVVLLLIVIVLAVSLGSTSIPIITIMRVLLNGTGVFHFMPDWDATIEIIIWQIRMPGVIGAALVGAALAVAGTLFQGLLRNPLADPFLIGTSSGAALGATISFVLPVAALYGMAFPLTALLAFIGALVTVFFVYGIANTGGRTPVVTLLLAGVVVNSVMVALQTLLLTLFPRNDFSLQSLFNWLSGGSLFLAGCQYSWLLCLFCLESCLRSACRGFWISSRLVRRARPTWGCMLSAINFFWSC